MNRYLDFFEPETNGAIGKSLEHAFERGARKAVVIGPKPCGHELTNTLNKFRILWIEEQLATFQSLDGGDADIVLVTGGDARDVSRVLHDCIERNIAVIAPVTQHHSSKRTVFLLSLPKAGTHMMIRLFELMGMGRSPERAPQPGTWCTPVGYHYHAPCRDMMRGDWFDPMGRHLLFRSPAIFVYRNPLDIVVSELDWFVRPEHTFSGYLNCCADRSEQLDRLIADSAVMGTIRERINGYVGWMNFNNVIPVSYEELVGERGGGSDADQLETIWALQLKLHIPGNPREYASRLYDPSSATFSRGRIGRHLEYFEERHFALVKSLPQDFMQRLGYSIGSRISSNTKEMRLRPLDVKELPADALYTPRLVREGPLDWNIVEIGGEYFPVRHGVDVRSVGDAQLVWARQEGFASVSDAVDAVIHGDAVPAPPAAVPQFTGTELVCEGYCGFNIVRHNRDWYGFDQALGPTDVGSLVEPAIEDLKWKGSCVSGISIEDVKIEILRIVMEQQQGKIKALQKEADGLSRAVREAFRKTGFGWLFDKNELKS